MIDSFADKNDRCEVMARVCILLFSGEAKMWKIKTHNELNTKRKWPTNKSPLAEVLSARRSTRPEIEPNGCTNVDAFLVQRGGQFDELRLTLWEPHNKTLQRPLIAVVICVGFIEAGAAINKMVFSFHGFHRDNSICLRSTIEIESIDSIRMKWNCSYLAHSACFMCRSLRAGKSRKLNWAIREWECEMERQGFMRV